MKYIELYGVKTNNLKNIDVLFPINHITAVTGVSGGGKSSLAYDSLYRKCRDEFLCVERGFVDYVHYEIDESLNIIPSIAIKQSNNNVNPRSTLYTYLNFYSFLSSLYYSGLSEINCNLLKINNPKVQCSACNGLGEQLVIDLDKVVDHGLTLSEGAIKPWVNKYDTMHSQLLVEYCRSELIPMDVIFSDLSSDQKDKLLYSGPTQKFRVSFCNKKRKRTRTLSFMGVISELSLRLISHSKYEYDSCLPYTRSDVCAVCMGSRVNPVVFEDKKICGIGFVDFLNHQIEDLIPLIKENNKKYSELLNVLQCISNLGLGYLSLSRSIPSLSGGELQKLNFSKICFSQISGILIVIDEITSQVYSKDYSLLWHAILSLRDRGNTIVLVEHNKLFVDKSDKVINIGPKPGDSGGYLVNDYIPVNHRFNKSPCLHDEYLIIDGICKNNLVSVSVKFPIGLVSVMVGPSGSGKSSIAEYIYETLPNVVYVSQQAVKANVRSTVASLSGVGKVLSRVFAKKYQLPESFFGLSEGGGLVCSNCNGRGVVKYQKSFEVGVEVVCPVCDGHLFSNEADLYTWNGLSLKKIYSLSFDDLFNIDDKSLAKISLSAIKLGLGHVSLNRKTKTLSGGELKRFKLLSNLPIRGNHNKILIIDEPASGLDDDTAFGVFCFIKELSYLYKAVILIDHKPVIFSNSDYLIEVGPGSGSNGGRITFSGDPDSYFNEIYKANIADFITT